MRKKYLRQAFVNTFFTAVASMLPSLVSGSSFVLWRFALGWLIMALIMSSISYYRYRQELKLGNLF